ncbi:hypothetical protein N182_26115 [Sinorhizobium sp. GL2]|nr:hypothetical protein N182_26115 [Sinorhizobium sp. GL2]
MRSHGIVAPWIVNAPMNSRIFETWIETELAPTLFLPPYAPDLNPIEMAFSKLKTLLRKRAARSFDAIAQALGDICNLYSVTECRNYFKAAGYEAD